MVLVSRSFINSVVNIVVVVVCLFVFFWYSYWVHLFVLEWLKLILMASTFLLSQPLLSIHNNLFLSPSIYPPWMIWWVSCTYGSHSNWFDCRSNSFIHGGGLVFQATQSSTGILQQCWSCHLQSSSCWIDLLICLSRVSLLPLLLIIRVGDFHFQPRLTSFSPLVSFVYMHDSDAPLLLPFPCFPDLSLCLAAVDACNPQIMNSLFQVLQLSGCNGTIAEGETDVVLLCTQIYLTISVSLSLFLSLFFFHALTENFCLSASSPDVGDVAATLSAFPNQTVLFGGFFVIPTLTFTPAQTAQINATVPINCPYPLVIPDHPLSH